MDNSKICDSFVSVDGTDCPINEPTPFCTAWYSHKMHRAGLRYEVGVSIKKGHIVWVNGPFPCGTYPDISIFKSKMLLSITSGEKVVADSGYSHDSCITPTTVRASEKEMHSLIRARHETVNSRLKFFSSVNCTFRHNVSLHASVFHAVANLTALNITTSDPLFSLNL